ncbi:MAG: S41 family peptidase [Defluviitaleaceae bacterium]|nr:S41 family peptidase [Defluviitaleaceae bacterium]MCL2238702.1 S41 family peptidase [Defluviitaleaceae bacterium]
MRKILMPMALLLSLVWVAACGRDNRQPVVSENVPPPPVHTPAPIVEAPVEIEIAEPEPPPVLSLADALAMANIRREGIVAPDIDRAIALTQDRVPQTLGMWEVFGREVTRPSHISTEDALYDVRLFFEVMRQVYGAYTYFGGDEIFLPILAELEATISASETWSANNFSTLLSGALSPVISDNHFHIDGRALGVRYGFFTGETQFARTANGFRNLSCGRYVAYVAEHDPEVLFRLSMNDYAKLYYIPVVVRYGGDLRYTLTVAYTCGYREEISLRRFLPGRHYSRPVTLTFAEGIPVVTIMAMGFPASTYGFNFGGARRFLEIAEEVRDEPVIIIDIRGNGGGNGSLASQWMHIVLGEIVPANFMGLQMRNYYALREVMKAQSYESSFYIPFAVFETYNPTMPLGDYHLLSHPHPHHIVENERLFVLLTDRYAGSAGDSFASMMLNIENTLIIGHNTAGVLHTDMTYPRLFLPRSGLQFGFGRTIHLHPEGLLPEGIGVAPDIWFTGTNMVPAVVQLIQEGLTSVG